jgi:hypothetical protein
LAEQKSITEILAAGLEQFRKKRFRDAEPYFQQVLLIEPRHTGAAYLLSLSYYFSGSFREAKHLFKQLLVPGNPLEPQVVSGLTELSRYANYECQRLDYWEGLKLPSADRIQKEINRRGLKHESLEAFHIYYINKQLALWFEYSDFNFAKVRFRITDRQNQIRIFSNCRDADSTIGPHLEVIQDDQFQFIPFWQIKVLEIGELKRWITGQILYQDGSRSAVYLPLVYFNSMADPASGVQEGVETVLREITDFPNGYQAFGQKQLRSDDQNIGLADVLSCEVI